MEKHLPQKPCVLSLGLGPWPNPRIDAIMEARQGDVIMDKQPNSRMCFAMCFACGVDNPIGLHLHFYTGDEGHRTLPSQTGASGLSRLTARGDHQHATGRPNSNS
jgi:hypothetical protein